MFLILDALADGGVKMGLSRQLSLRLATQTMLGSASMVMSELNNETNGKHLMQMKEEVTSPGGTTIYGIAELEKNKVRSSFIKCVEAATNRAKEMSSKN
jgi:pyrroline-5-carboxylate reductase